MPPPRDETGAIKSPEKLIFSQTNARTHYQGQAHARVPFVVAVADADGCPAAGHADI
jgi:hypothetical protein